MMVILQNKNIRRDKKLSLYLAKRLKEHSPITFYDTPEDKLYVWIYMIVQEYKYNNNQKGENKNDRLFNN